jgi:hypothetical protein
MPSDYILNYRAQGSHQRFYHLEGASASEETIRGYPDASTITLKKSSPTKAPAESDWFDSLREWEQAGSGAPKTSWDEEDDDYSDSIVLSTPISSVELPWQSSVWSSHTDTLDPENAFWGGAPSSEGASAGLDEDTHGWRPSSRQGFFEAE